MTKGEKEELNATIEQLEKPTEDDAEREEELIAIVNRLCEMDDKDYRKFILYMRYERKAQKHLSNMSQYA
jgi:hypothetical protein